LFHTILAKWIHDKRLQKAKELLFSTPLTIADICYEIGYENVSHFARLFKSHFGYTRARQESPNEKSGSRWVAFENCMTYPEAFK